MGLFPSKHASSSSNSDVNSDSKSLQLTESQLPIAWLSSDHHLSLAQEWSHPSSIALSTCPFFSHSTQEDWFIHSCQDARDLYPYRIEYKNEDLFHVIYLSKDGNTWKEF